MQLSLEAIQFNHSESATTDAFSIRKNETEQIVMPEWQRGFLTADQSVAAYARDQIEPPITIRARFTCADHSITSIEVQALDGHRSCDGGKLMSTANVLGKVKPTTVPLIAGQSDFVPFELEDVLIATVGVSRSETIWKWQFRVYSEDSFSDLVTTNHRIYTVLDLPTAPWKPLSLDSQDTQRPWTDVLDVAYEWAAGAQDIDAAATRITQEVNTLGKGKVTYFENPLYIQQGTDNFLCTEFLSRVRGGVGKGPTVNCSDCATAVSTFANILGASLSQSQMGYGFYTNRVLLIGETQDDGGHFEMHEVAWKGACDTNDQLFDACLLLDGDPEPGKKPFVPFLPVNIPFGLPADKQYRFRLARQYGNPCLPRPASKRRRFIGSSLLRRRVTSERQLEYLRDLYNFESWKQTQLSEDNLFVWGSSPDAVEIPGWFRQTIQSFETTGDMPATKEVLWATDKLDQVLRINTYECSSATAARGFLLELLGESHVAYMKREDPKERTNFGDIAFTNLAGTSILFARGNVVLSARSAGTVSAIPVEFLRQYDASLNLPPAEEDLFKIDRFRFGDGTFHVGDAVPLEFLADKTLTKVLYKFFAKSGTVFLKGAKLFYRPTVAGQQQLVVFAIDAKQKAGRQELEISIEDKSKGLATLNYNTNGGEILVKPPETDPVNDNVTQIGGIVMAHRLEGGPWRAFMVRNNMLVPDGTFYLTTIDPTTGTISNGYCDMDGTHLIKISGKVTKNGGAFSVVIDRPIEESLFKHTFEAIFAFDSSMEDRLVMVGSRYKRPRPAPPDGESPVNQDNQQVFEKGAVAGGGGLARADGQEDGTVIITKP